MSNRVRTAEEQARYIDSIQPAPGIGGSMEDRPLAIDVRYPPDSVEGFRPAFDSVERMVTADDLRAFYAKEAEHERFNETVKGIRNGLLAMLFISIAICGVVWCALNHRMFYVTAQNLMQFFGSMLR